MDWNEIEYISWREFKEMAPAILQLEIGHITKVLPACKDDIEVYNALVSARYAARQFAACLQKTEAAPLEDACLAHLNTAILKLTAAAAGCAGKERQTIHYIAEHLQAIATRGRLAYA